MVNSIFPPYRISPAIVGRRTQPPLHALAQPDIFPLYLIAELHRLLNALLRLASLSASGFFRSRNFIPTCTRVSSPRKPRNHRNHAHPSQCARHSTDFLVLR